MLNVEEIQNLINENRGYCTSCGNTDTDYVELDASGYHCDNCEEDTVLGAEEALLLGHFN